ncbi:MAG: hypothetical protein Q8S03_14480 [Brevundimonas sp.]|uniref:hypothetical protein n=1 Tax=Brevundimonas sp. TaxID=1871086 RepID=UPI002737701E|nr:hypothetical protein [Brevundimonas sp.]MDP3405896.1 hypothetical protein [Brevundimonas sp.]
MNIQIRKAGSLVAALAVLLAAPAAWPQDRPPADRPEYVDPRVYSAEEAVLAVGEAPNRGLYGQFAFIVRGWGRDGTRVFLNSQQDYRDSGTLTVALGGEAVAALVEQFGGPLDNRLIGRTIVATGVARRVRIDLTANGQPSGLFHAQTHVRVGQASEIHLVPGPAYPLSQSR